MRKSLLNRCNDGRVYEAIKSTDYEKRSGLILDRFFYYVRGAVFKEFLPGLLSE
jgi:hypothetical protein